MKLTQQMFGDLNCKAFGLSNNQMRHNSIINNAGWFNFEGQKLGSGDLALADMENIAKTIDPSDIFIVIAEIDAMWDMPSTFDHSAPGKDYVIQKAVWVIGKDKSAGSAIIRVRDNISKPEEATQDGVKYFRYPRADMYKSLGYTFKKIDLTGKEEQVKEMKKTIEEKMKDGLNKFIGNGKTGKVIHGGTKVKTTPHPGVIPNSVAYPTAPAAPKKIIKAKKATP